MELNAETVKKALDWLDSLVGNSNDSEMAMFTYQLLGILYDTCEELTEENKRLHESYTKVARNLHECKADTARKIQERLRSEKFHHMNFGDLVYLEDIDRISKEILEGCESIE